MPESNKTTLNEAHIRYIVLGALLTIVLIMAYFATDGDKFEPRDEWVPKARAAYQNWMAEQTELHGGDWLDKNAESDTHKQVMDDLEFGDADDLKRIYNYYQDSP